MNYWQVAAGDGERDYSAVFTKFGIMLIGPGGPGDYFENKDTYKKYHWGGKVKAFAEGARDGDVVVLKKPSKKQWQVLAVGRVKGEYQYLPVFDDVEGWDLQHCRSVEWVLPPEDKRNISGLTRGTFNRIRKAAIKEEASQVLHSGTPISSQPLPEVAAKLSDEDLINHLINNGLRPKDAEDLAQTIARMRRLVRWYWSHGADIKEHETRAFLILPLLFALGWSEQKLKIEWKATDIAFFEKPYGRKRSLNNCIMILESKRFWGGLTYAEGQVKKYAKNFPNCKHLIVSDGCCYKLFRREDDKWPYDAYLNILKPRSRHPYEEKISGAQDVLLSLMPK